jgi:hypothetical protein
MAKTTVLVGTLKVIIETAVIGPGHGVDDE